MVSNEKSWAVCVGVLKEQLRLHMLTDKEVKFAEGVVSFYTDKGYLSDKQFQWAWKLMYRVMMERDPFDPFPKQPCF